MSNSAVRATRPPVAIRSRTPRLPRATSSSLTPSGRSTSRVRGCTARARDSCTRSEAASTSTMGTPNAESCAASVRPVGPAPTTSTSQRSTSSGDCGWAMRHSPAAGIRWTTPSDTGSARRMGPGRMHADEVETDVALVRRLLAGQFPQWADLPVRPVPSWGTDNALYRLGDDLVVRLPRIGWAVTDVEAEQRRLRFLAPCLPLPIPEPLAAGVPGAGYPWPWSVYRWLPGEEARADRLADPVGTAETLAAFVAALHGVEVVDPPSGGGRGGPLAGRDAATRAAIAALDGEIDTGAVTAAREESLATPAWDGPPVSVHGDLAPGNLLLRDGRLSAVLDFAPLDAGD